MRAERSTIRRTVIALLVALVASFALSTPADAAGRKPSRVRAKHSNGAAAGAKTTAKRKATRKKKAAPKKSVRKSTVKRKPTTKPR